MTHPTCSSCGHYQPTEPWPRIGTIPWSAQGFCHYIPHNVYVRENDPEYTDRKAFVEDGSGYYASLMPNPDFYCPHHSEVDKSPQNLAKLESRRRALSQKA